jgi:serine phosphatase RsbU (regulator of sigma subunit)
VLLLGVTVTAVGYFLILHQQNVLTAEMEKTVILQGRNIALSSQKPLLRDDPEFELFPLVTRIRESTPRVASIVIVDEEGVVQGHQDLLKVSTQYAPELGSLDMTQPASLKVGESLYQDDNTYLFITPVVSAERDIGAVYLGYSKQDLYAGIQNAFRITLLVSLVALLLGVVVSFVFFRHISRPMKIMLDGVHSLGGGNLETRIEMPTRNEFHILADAFNDMSQRISTGQDELISKERVERELELAREIQLFLLPQKQTPPPGFEISHYYKSASEVGGDYVDVIPLDGDRVALAMADVSGKGVPGLVVMAMVKALLQELVVSSDSPRTIVRSLNRALQGNIKTNMFVTFFIGILDAHAGRLTMSNAGHNPLIIYSREMRTTRMLRMSGPPLGPFDPDTFDTMVETYDVDMRAGDLVIQYTDGLNESRNTGGDQFGIPGIVSLAESHASLGAESLVQELVEAEARFRGQRDQFDDITLLALSALSRRPTKTEESVAQPL